MNDGPYRDQPCTCPACGGGTVLRPFQERLVCDVCGGMQTSTADLAHAIEDLTGAEVQLEFFDEQPGGRACPHCRRAMTRCRLRVVFPVHEKRPKMEPWLDRCADDGVWFDANELAEVFEKARHTVTDGAGYGRTYGGAGC